MIHKHSELRREWLKLVREKLVPLNLLTPVGPETHEWSRTYRDLIFEMAVFIDRQGGEITSDLVRQFIAYRPANDIVASFSAREIGALMRKAVEYDLPVRDRDHHDERSLLSRPAARSKRSLRVAPGVGAIPHASIRGSPQG